jgi:hypothetical protein
MNAKRFAHESEMADSPAIRAGFDKGPAEGYTDAGLFAATL